MKRLAGRLFHASDFPGWMRLIRALMAPFRKARSAYGPRVRVRARDYTNLAALFGPKGGTPFAAAIARKATEPSLGFVERLRT